MEDDMSTVRRHPFVSVIASVTISLALAACFHGAARRPSPGDHARLAIRFDNEAREHVHVYLIGENRQWLLGRVEAGAIDMLRIPEESLVRNPTLVRLVVIAGEGVTLQAARHPRATPTLAQPVWALLSHRWRFSQGALTSLRR
jgi:hypothetical protein